MSLIIETIETIETMQIFEAAYLMSPINQSVRVYESESNIFYFVTPLSEGVLSPYFLWRFFETIAITDIPRCYGN